jgi:hypothetical protein
MEEKKGLPTDSTSIIEKIENQIKETLTKKKKEIEKELKENIRREKQKAEKKIKEVESEISEEEKVLTRYRKMLVELESSKLELKKQIQEHLDTAIQIQAEIETLTGKTLDELKQVGGLSQKLEEIQQDAGEKVSSLKKDLEERFGFIAQVPEEHDGEGAEINLDKELSKLKKIKELLSSGEEEESAVVQQIAQASTSPELPEEPVEETIIEDKEPPPEEYKDEEEEKEETLAHLFAAELEKYRRAAKDEEEGKIHYFENKGRILIDGESLISVLSQCLKEVRELYKKLEQTDSPKNQFFIKQDIIKCQETLRKITLHCIRMCEKNNYSVPEYTSDVLNEEVLKNFLEKISMANWSNKNDFSSFEDYAEDLKIAYYRRIASPEPYFRSVIQELEKE